TRPRARHARAPRLWHKVSSVTSQTREPGTKEASSLTQRMRPISSQFQAAELNRRKALEWSSCRERPVVSQTRLTVRRPRQTTQAALMQQKVLKTSGRKQPAKGASREARQGVR